MSSAYPTSATMYGALPSDSYYNLAAPGLINGDLEVTGDLKIDGVSEFVGKVTMLDGLDVTGGVTIQDTGLTIVAGGANITGDVVADGNYTSTGSFSGTKFYASTPNGSVLTNPAPPGTNDASSSRLLGAGYYNILGFNVTNALAINAKLLLTVSFMTQNTDNANNYSMCLNFRNGTAGPENIFPITGYQFVPQARNNISSELVPTAACISGTIELVSGTHYTLATPVLYVDIQGNGAFPFTSIQSWSCSASLVPLF